MKTTSRTISLVSALVLTLVAGGAYAHYEYQHRHGCDEHMTGGMMSDYSPMSRMQEMMRENRALMEQIVEEPDRQKREEMMQQHMQPMHGQMMGRSMSPGSGSASVRAPSQQQLEMMSRRLDRMQQMIEQMQQQQGQN